jgi:hypothetical protein
MTQRAIIVPEALAVASGIITLIGLVYFTHKYLATVDQADASHFVTGGSRSAELSNPDLRLWRVHVLLR